jgi:hypothetical protein
MSRCRSAPGYLVTVCHDGPRMPQLVHQGGDRLNHELGRNGKGKPVQRIHDDPQPPLRDDDSANHQEVNRHLHRRDSSRSLVIRSESAPHAPALSTDRWTSSNGHSIARLGPSARRRTIGIEKPPHDTRRTRRRSPAPHSPTTRRVDACRSACQPSANSPERHEAARNGLLLRPPVDLKQQRWTDDRTADEGEVSRAVFGPRRCVTSALRARRPAMCAIPLRSAHRARRSPELSNPEAGAR